MKIKSRKNKKIIHSHNKKGEERIRKMMKIYYYVIGKKGSLRLKYKFEEIKE